MTGISFGWTPHKPTGDVSETKGKFEKTAQQAKEAELNELKGRESRMNARTKCSNLGKTVQTGSGDTITRPKARGKSLTGKATKQENSESSAKIVSVNRTGITQASFRPRRAQSSITDRYKPDSNSQIEKNQSPEQQKLQEVKNRVGRLNVEQRRQAVYSQGKMSETEFKQALRNASDQLADLRLHARGDPELQSEMKELQEKLQQMGQKFPSHWNI